jgi:hypothetical protein
VTSGGERDLVAPVPRVALTRGQAAAALGMSLNHFERHVQPTMRLLRVGSKVLVPVAELERWCDANSRRTV